MWRFVYTNWADGVEFSCLGYALLSCAFALL